MTNFATGYEVGKDKETNPMASLLRAIKKSYQRRREEDEKRASEEKELSQALIKLTAEQNIKAKAERENLLLKGIAEGDIEETTEIGEGTFEGTPFGVMGKRYKAKKKETPVYLVDPVTGETRQVASTEKGAKVLQEKPTLEQEATRAEIKKLAEIKPNLDRANEAIQELRSLFEKGDVSKSIQKGDILGGLFERGKGVFEGTVAKAGANPSLQQYLKLRKSFASLITKGGFLEAGVLTNPDIERALGALPTTGSTKEEIELGWKTLNNIMTSAQKRFEELKSGEGSKSKKSGGQTMIDSQGNRAIVYPDGSYEEIK